MKRMYIQPQFFIIMTTTMKRMYIEQETNHSQENDISFNNKNCL